MSVKAIDPVGTKDCSAKAQISATSKYAEEQMAVVFAEDKGILSQFVCCSEIKLKIEKLEFCLGLGICAYNFSNLFDDRNFFNVRVYALSSIHYHRFCRFRHQYLFQIF